MAQVIASLALFAGLASAPALATAGSAFASSAATNDLAAAELAPVVVYATRIDGVASSVPASVRILDDAAIAESGARDLPELLDKAANLQVRTMNANPVGAHVAMRGFGEWSFGRVKILVDGEELNDVDMQMPNLVRIPLGSIRRVEIVNGPSPVLYGDGAVAGLINVITDNRDYRRRTKLSASVGSFGSAGANVQTHGGVAEDGLLYSAAYDYRRSDGYRDRSAYDLHAANTSLRKEFANGSAWGVKAHYFNAFYEMPGALTYDQWKRDRRQAVYGDDWCRLWSYGLSSDAKLRLIDDQWLYVDGTFSVKHRESSWGDYHYSNDYDLYGYQFSPRYVDERCVGGFDQRFTLGTDFRFDQYEVDDRSGFNSPHYDFFRGRYAVFAEEEFFLTDELSVVAGARCECIDNRWHRYRGLKEHSSTDTMGDFELGLVYRPNADLKLFAKGTRFHRSAFCDELNYTRDGTFLKPETGESLDVGLAGVVAEEWKYELSGYWMVMDDEIFYDPHAQEYGGGAWGGYNCNSPGQTERLGADVALAWRRERTAEAAVRAAYVQSRFRDGKYEGERIPLVPEGRVRVEAGVWIFDDLELKGGYRYVTSQVLMGDFENAHERLAAYSLFDCGILYEPRWAKGWKVSAVVDNLFDRNTCDFAGWSEYAGAYYYPAAGRTFQLTVSYAF